ncbi:MAG: decaprenyl-phosphate phosphoribosyltransferase [Terriglobales bacterium]
MSSAPPTSASPHRATAGSQLMGLLAGMRPHQWTKNAFCFAGVIFSGRFFEPIYVIDALLTFVAFCFASSAVYLFNDIKDVELDRLHRTKRDRPLVTGRLLRSTATVVAITLMLGAAAVAFLIGWKVVVCVVLYLLLNLLYSVGVKHVALLDVLFIASGFVLRLLAGIYAVQEIPTSWITLCTFFLALFLGFCKRRSELQGLGDSGEAPRPVLNEYSLPYLDMLLSSSATITVICYALFTTAGGKNHTLVLTVPIVYFAISHYKRRVLMAGAGQEPDRILLQDRRLQVSILLWLVLYMAVMYIPLDLFR